MSRQVHVWNVVALSAAALAASVHAGQWQDELVITQDPWTQYRSYLTTAPDDTLYVLEAFSEGFDSVVVFRCREGHCHNLIGNLDMDRRLNLLRTVLRSRNIDDSRLRIVDISPDEGEGFAAAVNETYENIKGLAKGKEAV